jgi:hypothetical protein
VPILGGHSHKADADRFVQVQVLGAILNYFFRPTAHGFGGDIQDAGLDASRAEASPVRLSQAQNESVLG